MTCFRPAYMKTMTCRYQRTMWLTIVCVFWTTLFLWLTLVTKTKQPAVMMMSHDFRNVPGLRDPPVELSPDGHERIVDMIQRLRRHPDLLTESDELVFKGKHPKWPFRIPRGKSLIEFQDSSETGLTYGEQFATGVRQFALYDPDELDVDSLLHEMSIKPVKDMEEVKGGTQLKFKLYLDDYGPVMFKPQRYDRSYETSPNQFYFSDYERHTAEIAAFHLDRILGWYRAPPVIGRTLNIPRDLRRFVKPKTELKKSFFTSPANNSCFHGVCKYYCDTTNAFCGNPDDIEGSAATFLPPESLIYLYKVRSPWRRSYNTHRLANWRLNSSYCDYVRLTPEFNKGRHLMDIIDTHIFDFLIGNLDRHHYSFYKGFPKNNTFHILFDHGRGFGRINHDELSILGPLVQCCSIRYSTLYKLITFYKGSNSLGDTLRKSLSRDPVAPVLHEGHYGAVNRRVGKILAAVADCLSRNYVTNVVIDDGF